MADPEKIVKFISSGRGKAQGRPNPNYPKGIALDMAMGAGGPHCTVKLPYPAPECGLWSVTCDHCNSNIIVTAAGRPDDPISIKIPCFATEEKRYA